MVLVDRAGRKTLLLIGFGGMCVCAMGMTIGLVNLVRSLKLTLMLQCENNVSHHLSALHVMSVVFQWAWIWAGH